MKIAVEEWELYNNGILLIKWFDTAEDTIEEIEEYVREAKRANGLNADDTELFIADHEADYSFDSECIHEAYRVAEQMESLDTAEQTAVNLLIENSVVSDINEAIEHIEDLICTNETSMEDIAYNYVNECSLLESMPSSLQGYFDYEALGRDMDLNGSYYEDEDGILWEYVA